MLIDLTQLLYKKRGFKRPIHLGMGLFIFTNMKKVIVGLDFILQLLVLLIGSGFLVYQNTFFAGQLMFICWLPFLIHTLFSLAGMKEFPNVRQSLFSVLNFCLFGTLVFLNQLILIEFFISMVLAEVVAISMAISYFFLFKKGLNDRTAKELFGKKGAILGAIFFTAIIYPYIGEAYIYLDNNEASIYMLLAFAVTLSFGFIRQVKSIEALVNRRNKDPKAVEEELAKALDQTQPMDLDTKIILISLGLWWAGIGAIWVVYVHNA
ncbi:MAG: hypothetical protein ACI857_000397 [Arenicella sp.]